MSELKIDRINVLGVYVTEFDKLNETPEDKPYSFYVEGSPGLSEDYIKIHDFRENPVAEKIQFSLLEIIKRSAMSILSNTTNLPYPIISSRENRGTSLDGNIQIGTFSRKNKFYDVRPLPQAHYQAELEKIIKEKIRLTKK